MANDNLHIVDPTAAHTHTVIFLHDCGSDHKEFADQLLGCVGSEPMDQPRTLQDLFPSIRWVFPNAPILPSSRLGTHISQWCDMWSMENPTERPELQTPGLQLAICRMLGLLEEEERMVPRERIFIAGIGQGFAAAIATFYADARGDFAGLIGLGGWLPAALCCDEYRRVAGTGWLTEDPPPLSRRGAAPSRDTYVFLGHSMDDDVVPIANGRELMNIAQAQRLRVEWREYEDGGHAVNEPDGVDDLARFIKARITGVLIGV
ncbi:lysophospholipase II [Nemania serpens]|nr:lysophospholipase II [Nemania serpens]